MANRGSRMTKQWVGMTGSSISFTADATGILGSTAFLSAATILRCMGEYAIGPSAAPADNDVAVVGCGLAVVSTDAVTAGAASMPEPLSDIGYPWLFWAVHPLRFDTTTVDVSAAVASVRHSFDVKSMRRVKASESLVWIAEYFDFNGAPPLAITGAAVRVLAGS